MSRTPSVGRSRQWYNGGSCRAPGAVNTPTLLAHQRRDVSPWTYPHCTLVSPSQMVVRPASRAATSIPQRATTGTATTRMQTDWPRTAARAGTRLNTPTTLRVPSRRRGSAYWRGRRCVWPFSRTTAAAFQSAPAAVKSTGSFSRWTTSRAGATSNDSHSAAHRMVSTAGYVLRAIRRATAFCVTIATWHAASTGCAHTNESGRRWPGDLGWLDRASHRTRRPSTLLVGCRPLRNPSPCEEPGEVGAPASLPKSPLHSKGASCVRRAGARTPTVPRQALACQTRTRKRALGSWRSSHG
jgi:hypothetical protein